MGTLRIRELELEQIPVVMDWSRREGFAPGFGDFEIYRHTDRQGLWIAWLDQEPVGCIAGVRYNLDYGFIGLYLVVPQHRGHGYGRELWKHALRHLSDLTCIGLEAAPSRITDYASWGFESSSLTTRWRWSKGDCIAAARELPKGLRVVGGVMSLQQLCRLMTLSENSVQGPISLPIGLVTHQVRCSRLLMNEESVMASAGFVHAC